MATAYRVTLKYPDGATMFMGTVHAEEIIQIPAKDRPSPNGPPPADTGERMTDPQKRYLFRLLGAQGVTGKAAEDHLKQHFAVGKLADIPKALASEYINQLVKDKQEASGGGA
jgi:hypothetical protein